MKRLVLTALLTGAAVFAQSTPAPKADTPKSDATPKKHRHSKKVKKTAAAPANAATPAPASK